VRKPQKVSRLGASPSWKASWRFCRSWLCHNHKLYYTYVVFCSFLLYQTFYATFIGYYKNAQKTADAIDDDGWLHSGDIGIWLENGALRIVDRKKNIFKTTRGEYIAPEKIENTYLKCPLVEKMWVYGDSMHTEIMAVVHPSPASLYLWAKDGGAPVPEWDFDTKKPATDAQMKAAQASTFFILLYD
jgi:long-subunit acyl-CoA synthetase (AMP-forming)